MDFGVIRTWQKVVVLGGICAAALVLGAPVRADTGPADVTDATDTAEADVSDAVSADVGDAVDGASTADATEGDATDATPSDVGDTAVPDAGDTGTRDGSDVDAASDVDTGEQDGVGSDAEEDVLVDAGPSLRYSGRVSVQFGGGDDGGVAVELRRADGEGRWERTTDEDGAFSFGGLAPGEYEVEISLQGYTTIGEAFALEGDRHVRYRLFQDQDVDLQVRALFPDRDDVPGEVEMELRGERPGEGRSATVEIDEENVATWAVEELGVGTWTVSANASEYEPLSFEFEARGPDRQSRELDLRLYMRPEPGEPPPADTSGCNCSDRDSGQGTPSPGPYAPPAIVVVFGLSLVVWRVLRTDP